MNPLKIYKKMESLPMGKTLFSKAVCAKAPYFSSINPRFKNYDVGLCEVEIKKRKAVHNHLGTVHAIAMCNLAELCAGMAIDSCMPKDWRWIPKGMKVDYLKKAMTDLTGKTEISQDDLVLGDNVITVNVRDKNQDLVFKAEINMYVSPKK